MEREQDKQKEKKIDEGNTPNILKEILLEITHFFLLLFHWPLISDKATYNEW